MEPFTLGEALEILRGGEDLSSHEVVSLFDHLLKNNDAAQWTAILSALAIKGESIEEVVGVAMWLRQKMTPISLPNTYDKRVVDCCGTGGDQMSTFNISTLAAIIATTGDVPIVKHANRSASGNFGSIDLLEAINIPFAQNSAQAVSLLTRHNIVFLDAPSFHPALKKLSKIRKLLGIPTTFNLAAPLANPAYVEKQMIGVWESALVPFIAEVALELGADSGMTVCGNGLDEFSTLDMNEYARIDAQGVELNKYNPSRLTLHSASESDLVCAARQDYIEKAMKVINGVRCPESDIVALNAGAIFYLDGTVKSIDEGFALAENIILSGKVKEKVESMRL